jgi:Putative outer membrane beta-barrel porin, MtrB/PioB
VRFSTSPDNEANRTAFGGQIKLARQTRVAADLSFQQMTQNASFLPFTINTAIFTPAGVPATSLSALPQQSLDGKIDTTMFNVSFVSRPISPLSIRMRYRSYDLEHKSTPISWLGGSTSGSPDRSWSPTSAAADAPYGYATANPYDNSSKRFDAQVGFDAGLLTLEGAYRYTKLERTWREATSGKEDGYSLAAVLRGWEWVSFRGMVEQLSRTADGETVYGFQADEADRDRTRAGVDIDLTPFEKVGFVFSYYHWNDDYPNRPDRVQVSGGAPAPGAQPIPGTPSGLLEASYDTYTLEADFTPNARTEVSAYYTWEKNKAVNQWSTTTGAALNNLLNYRGTDRGDTFGANARVDVVPDKWTVSFLLRHQKVDGLMDITANETGTFYNPGRTTLVPAGQGGAGDITDYDDTKLTTVVADLAYKFAKAWTWAVGYAYEDYSIADAYTDGTTIFPQSVLFFMKADDGSYEANILYTRLTYRF